MSILLFAASAGSLRIIALAESVAGSESTGNSQARLEWDNDGSIDSINDGTPGSEGSWMIPVVVPTSNYEIKFEKSAGDSLEAGSAALSTWLGLGTDRYIELAQSGAGSKSANGTYIIREAATMTEVANSTWALSVEVLS